MMEKPEWAEEYKLEACGQYYQGFVDDSETVLTKHCMATVTTYGVRKSRKNHAVSEKNSTDIKETSAADGTKESDQENTQNRAQPTVD